MIHVLKCWPAYFDAIRRGEKTFEVRRDDRGFQKGDTVILHRTYEDNQHIVEYDFKGNALYQLKFTIGWILTGGRFGIEPGFVVFSLTPEDKPNA